MYFPSHVEPHVYNKTSTALVRLGCGNTKLDLSMVRSCVSCVWRISTSVHRHVFMGVFAVVLLESNIFPIVSIFFSCGILNFHPSTHQCYLLNLSVTFSTTSILTVTSFNIKQQYWLVIGFYCHFQQCFSYTVGIRRKGQINNRN